MTAEKATEGEIFLTGLPDLIKVMGKGYKTAQVSREYLSANPGSETLKQLLAFAQSSRVTQIHMQLALVSSRFSHLVGWQDTSSHLEKTVNSAICVQ